MYGYVYKTTDLSNGKIYVGQHKSEKFDTNYFGSGKILKRKIKQCGIENFSCEILQECFSEKELNEQEIFWIKELNSRDKKIGYNITTGGSFGDSGYHLGMLGKHQSNKQKEVVRNYMKNRIVSEESKEKMSKSKMGNKNAAGNIGYIHIFKNDCEIKIKPEQLNDYVEDGWQQGHKKYSDEFLSKNKEKYKNSCYIRKNEKIKLILKDELEKYLNEGWILGRGSYSKETCEKISQSQKGRICITNGKVNKYINPENLFEYENNGWFKMTKEKYNKLYK